MTYTTGNAMWPQLFSAAAVKLSFARRKVFSTTNQALANALSSWAQAAGFKISIFDERQSRGITNYILAREYQGLADRSSQIDYHAPSRFAVEDFARQGRDILKPRPRRHGVELGEVEILRQSIPSLFALLSRGLD